VCLLCLLLGQLLLLSCVLSLKATVMKFSSQVVALHARDLVRGREARFKGESGAVENRGQSRIRGSRESGAVQNQGQL
jgi:hypothetical protein